MHLQSFTPGTLASLVRLPLAHSFVGGIYPHKEWLHACCTTVFVQSEHISAEVSLVALNEDITQSQRNPLVRF